MYLTFNWLSYIDYGIYTKYNDFYNPIIIFNGSKKDMLIDFELLKKHLKICKTSNYISNTQSIKNTINPVIYEFEMIYCNKINPILSDKYITLYEVYFNNILVFEIIYLDTIDSHYVNKLNNIKNIVNFKYTLCRLLDNTINRSKRKHLLKKIKKIKKILES